ncbi:MAG TPA: amidase, partial [Spirochaetia bacterium]|nr:amidase [Spirochaetia bacterium]
LKPTIGRVSTRGVLPLSWNLDHVGPLARCVRDAARVLRAIAGYDEADPSSVRMAVGDYLQDLAMDVRGQRIALGVGEHIGIAEREVQEAVGAAARVFESLGCSVREVNVDWMKEAALANRLMTQSDGAAVHRDRLANDPGRFGDDVRRRLEAGAATTSTEYILARRTQAEARRTCDRLFETADLLILPTTPMAAPAIVGYDAVQRAGQLTPFTAPFNLTGLPALSVPCGFTSERLPIGLQIVGKAWEEGRVLRAGHAFEQRTDWHTLGPE